MLLLFAVVANTVGFVDATDNSPIVFVLDTNKDVRFLEFFLESFIPFICPKRSLNLRHQFWVQVVSMTITSSWERFETCRLYEFFQAQLRLGVPFFASLSSQLRLLRNHRYKHRVLSCHVYQKRLG